MVYSVIGADSLRIARESNNAELLSTAIKKLIARMSRQGVSNRKINSSFEDFLTKITQILIMFVKVRKNC